MNGDIGSLVQDGEQIGGFLSWTIDLVWAGGKVVRITSTADKFWWLCSPSQREIKALYYRLTGSKLVLITQSKVELHNVDKKLEMIWTT